jgi:hypothetical protein
MVILNVKIPFETERGTTETKGILKMSFRIPRL